MKRIILYLILLIMPLNVLAYSNKIIAGGESIGIDIKSDGIMIVGFYRVNGKLNNNNLKVGDIIYKVANTPVSSINELTKEVSKNVKDNKVTIGIKRGEDKFDVIFNLYKDGDNYRTGLYVKDGISGIGTLTYIDPETKIYGALGHEIIESASMKRIEVKRGTIFRSSVTNIEPSAKGYAGTKNAKFYSNDIYGNIVKNTLNGIYGIYTKDTSNKETYEVGSYNDIKLGKAYILTVINKEKKEAFEINIDNKKEGTIKNIHFEITDNNLLNLTGGVVQGMSGSPIIQDGKIIGAVTHVIVDKPSTGYGILITNMLVDGATS